MERNVCSSVVCKPRKPSLNCLISLTFWISRDLESWECSASDRRNAASQRGDLIGPGREAEPRQSWWLWQGPRWGPGRGPGLARSPTHLTSGARLLTSSIHWPWGIILRCDLCFIFVGDPPLRLRTVPDVSILQYSKKSSLQNPYVFPDENPRLFREVGQPGKQTCLRASSVRAIRGPSNPSRQVQRGVPPRPQRTQCT